jgi:subtilase family serine protease
MSLGSYVRWLLVVVLLLCGIASYAQQPRQVVHDEVRAAILNGQTRSVGQLLPSQRMNLSIVLPLRNEVKLEELLKQLYDPASPVYHKFLSVSEFTDRFSPSAGDFNAVVNFALANGLAVASRPPNRLEVPISGTVNQIEKIFNVRMNLYRHPTENRTFFSADREPSLALNVPIAHISGLSNYSLPRPNVVKLSALRASGSPLVQGSGPGGSYLGKDMRAAYYGGTALTGSGQVVALVQFDG